MAKVSGGTRTYAHGAKTYKKRQAEIDVMLASGQYSEAKIGKGGGYYAIEKSSARHKPEEIEVAKILASKGYKVILKNEAGSITTVDGHIFKASFEQRTPTKDASTTIRNGLFHARDKGADIAILYSKSHTFSRRSVEEGIKLYEKAHPYRFQQIIVVADNGHIHRYKHTQ